MKRKKPPMTAEIWRCNARLLDREKSIAYLYRFERDFDASFYSSMALGLNEIEIWPTLLSMEQKLEIIKKKIKNTRGLFFYYYKLAPFFLTLHVTDKAPTQFDKLFRTYVEAK